MSATTYRDFFTRTLGDGTDENQGDGNGQGVPDFVRYVSYALASGATPLGFPPALLDRSKDRAVYEAAGIQNDSGDWRLWYSDGGDLDNEPFGRLLDLIEGIQSDDDRVVVLLDCEPSNPTWGGKWFDADSQPTWSSTLLRVNHIRSNQNYYEDLRRLEKTNAHLEWVHRVANALDTAFEELDANAPPEFKASVIAVRDRALATYFDIRQDAEAIHGVTHHGADADRPDRPGPGAASFSELLEAATGLHGKRPVKVEIISPEIDPSEQRVARQQLAGDFLYHFGGFLDEAFRRSDFSIGYRNATTWLERWLTTVLPETKSRDIVSQVRKRFDALSWAGPDEGNASLQGLSLAEKGELLLLVAHIGKVIAAGLYEDVHADGLP